ncbi:hypothetical protein [Pseudomonas leptonychotis]|uniref:hypothetical protein n=1 Tax=Pseudomonas leptonychotis TaxID=2448482 RepID=UPI0039EF7306
MSVGAWSYESTIKSPNGIFTASIVNANEIAMGAPTSGTLKLSTGFAFNNCNPSFVWSDDSKFIAVPVWQGNRSQRLAIINVEDGKINYHETKFRVLELSSFIKGVVSGIDSPIYKPKKVELKLCQIIKSI